MGDELYVWISRWEEFQHYKPQRDRGPAWIKQHTAQLLDERYLSLTMVQRAILHDLRLLFSQYRGRLSSDCRALSKKIGHRVTSAQLQALNDAGLIDFCSRAVLYQRLEDLYASRAPVRSLEVEVEVEEEEEQEQPGAVLVPRDPEPQLTNGRTAPDLERITEADLPEALRR